MSRGGDGVVKLVERAGCFGAHLLCSFGTFRENIVKGLGFFDVWTHYSHPSRQAELLLMFLEGKLRQWRAAWECLRTHVTSWIRSVRKETRIEARLHGVLGSGCANGMRAQRPRVWSKVHRKPWVGLHLRLCHMVIVGWGIRINR